MSVTPSRHSGPVWGKSPLFSTRIVLAAQDKLLRPMELSEVEITAVQKHARNFPKGWTASRTGMFEAALPTFEQRCMATAAMQGLLPSRPEDMKIFRLQICDRLKELIKVYYRDYAAGTAVSSSAAR